mgnify:CR=1 FL=1
MSHFLNTTIVEIPIMLLLNFHLLYILYIFDFVLVILIVLLKNIIINNHDINVSFVISILLLIPAEIASILVLLYCLKLKYAKDYALEEYLPTGPHPSKYTGWK